jgi:GH35 family endo-1,4-beta-xylanase
MPTGLLRFLVPEPERLTERALTQAYLCGLDPIPTFCRAQRVDDLLHVEREGTESTKLNLPWRIDGHGEPLIATATLIQRDRPYILPLELARGKLNQLRNQIGDWVAQGLVVPDDVAQRLADATRLFTRAAVSQVDPNATAQAAQGALTAVCDVAEAITASYVEQVLTIRHRTAAKLPVAFGANLGQLVPDAATLSAAAELCNTAGVSMLWRDVAALEDAYAWEAYAAQIEWCRARNVNVAAGPLIRLDDRGFPDWMQLYQADVDGILAFTAEYVSNVVRKWRGQVTMWHVASYAQRGPTLGLREEDKLRVIVRAVETARRHDPDAPLIVSFDQPWGEYLGRVPLGYSPLHVADHLVRSGLPITALGLEFEIGYGAAGTPHRDPLEFSRILDVWASLGVPLYVCLTVAGGRGADAKANAKGPKLDETWPGGWSVEAQAEWIKKFVPVLLAKPLVQGITWSAPSDHLPHELSHGGLLDAAGRPKPGFQALCDIRKNHLV